MPEGLAELAGEGHGHGRKWAYQEEGRCFGEVAAAGEVEEIG